jgi:hypothetical protein
MSKKAAIHLAIATQLASEGKTPLDLRYALGDPPLAVPGAIAANAVPAVLLAHVQALQNYAEDLRKNGAGGLGYDESASRNFLARVAFQLRADDPPLKFDWSKVNAADARMCKLYNLIDMIALETVYLDERRADEKADKT